MVHRLLVGYGMPADTDDFDKHYRDVHIGIANGMPGVVKYTIGHAQSADENPSPFHLVAELDFESVEAMGAAMGSEAGATAVADIPNFANGGVTICHYDVEDVTG